MTESRIKKKFTEFICNIEDAFLIAEPCPFIIKAYINCTIFAFKMVVCTGSTVFSVKRVQCAPPYETVCHSQMMKFCSMACTLRVELRTPFVLLPFSDH